MNDYGKRAERELAQSNHKPRLSAHHIFKGKNVVGDAILMSGEYVVHLFGTYHITIWAKDKVPKGYVIGESIS